MRRTLTLAVRAAAVAAAAVLLSACSGDDGGSASSPSSSATSSAAETSEPAAESEAPQGDSEFCTQSQDLLDELGAAFTEQSDPASVETAFQQAAEGFRSVEPPSDIEQDWTTLGDGLEEYAAAFSELDQSDPESVTAFQERTSALQGELTGAATNVETYLNEECGIDTEAEPSAAGSSTPSS
jgi:hypothetical protein